jgi:YebC/PmpR family DNA-binding regulatory protein
MSGHSHWARIKHKKGMLDARRGKLWSKLIRAVMIAARDGGDPRMNLKLEYAIGKAKDANVPRETIDRAVKKGTGELEGERLEEMVLEGYGPGGVALMIETLTDNRNRVLSEMRKIFERGGGSLAGANAVAFQFERKGLVTVNAEGVGEDAVLEAALEAGADNVVNADGVWEITCSVPDFIKVLGAVRGKFAVASSDLAYLPTTRVPVNDPEKARKLMALLQAIDDQEDVQHVYANYEFPDAVAAAIESETSAE